MTSAPHILVVDDDPEIRDLLSRFLDRHGMRVSTAGDGRGMEQKLSSGSFDLVVLDVMLPGDDGLVLCRKLRATSPLPVIMLTAVGEETDRIIGLEMGADDYLTKPFNPRELLARIKAVLRRTRGRTTSEEASRQLLFAGWKLDLGRRELRSPKDVLVSLTSGELDLLIAFAEHSQRVLSRDQLLDLTKGRSAALFDRSIDIQISRLRRKIEDDPKQPQLIKTVRSEGYLFACAVEKS